MKRINKFALFILGALSFASCSDINDIESEGYRITGEQIDDATSVIPSRVEAKIAGMYSSMGTVCAAFPSDTRDDDGWLSDSLSFSGFEWPGYDLCQ